ncbi:parkin coregulated gene protein homolog [Centruroides sculpturatus]|uniref:parkin coregulated gene protein homolog n=1 Tax=Centruroides sculpturatus TaxID=218467 RepID=UPI000C6D5840|nr:parkin coregulated gene protein homolog [Centruroides sculpturatus]
MNTSEFSPPMPRFRQRYCSGEIPVTLVRENFGWNLYWKVPIKDIDFGYYLPIFFEGLRETRKPFDLIANIGLHEMLDILEAQNSCHFLDEIIPHLINGLTSDNPNILLRSLMALQHLYDVTQLFLHPYLNRILPALNEIKEKFRDCTDPERIKIVVLVSETIAILAQEYL